MPRQAPYLQRRGDTLFFRIAVPLDLRVLVGGRELTKTLRTADKRDAMPIALEFAATAKRLFNDLRAGMAVADDSKLRELILKAKGDMRIKQLKEQHDDALTQQRLRHLEEMERVKIEAKNEALQLLLAQPGRLTVPTPIPTEEALPAPRKTASVVTFKTVVETFLTRYEKKNKPSMLKKHRQVLPMLLEIVGDKPVSEILQADINNFFELLDKLPPRWADACRREGVTIRQLAELDHDLALGPKAFEDTYIASVRPFLKAARKDWQDQGFPLGLSTDGIEYLGDREEGENKQRAFSRAELKRLFEGAEMKGFAADPARAHFYWLPLVGLYTGARVNEICQLNPQTDILEDAETGVNYFWITKDTEADSRITKSVKTGDSRKVPIHKKLIELGFLEYVQKVRAAGSRLIFPAWEPINRRASGNAEKWFRRFLRDAGLRDETPKEMILGMHAFRHTLLSYGAAQRPPLSLFCITGHVQGDTPIHATGAGKGYLTLSLVSPLDERAALLNYLDYGLSIMKPKKF
jgi:integrase